MRVVKTSVATQDIIESAVFIGEDNPQAVARFIEAVEESTEVIRRNPKIGRLKKFAHETELRMWFVTGFPRFLIFYSVSELEIRIGRIIHTSKDYTKVFSG